MPRAIDIVWTDIGQRNKIMENSGEQPKFEIKTIVEQKPFESEAVRGFFDKWCKVNDSIKLKFVDRDEWDIKKEEGILQKRERSKLNLFFQKRTGEKSTIFIPKDLQLWEMIGVIEAVDNDTFANKLEMTGKAKEKISDLGKTFEDAGIFIAKRIEGITQGREIAEALALEFYEYGQALKSGVKPEMTVGIEDLAQKELTSEETEKSERFLAGETLYNSRHKRAEEKSKNTGLSLNLAYEAECQETLNQFFRVADKAFKLQDKEKTGELIKKKNNSLKPWKNDTPIHNAFIKRIKQSLVREIETPKQELVSSVFRRGMELLQRYMPFDKLPREVKDTFLHWQNGEKTLREALQIDKLKAELAEVRKTQDIAKISEKEREIADSIQIIVSNFPGSDSGCKPSEMIATQLISCVGASTLGGTLMNEVGLNYLVGAVPNHSILFLVTADGSVEWRDMLNPQDNENLKDNMIKGQKEDGFDLTVADIVAFSKNPTPKELMFDIQNMDSNKLSWVEAGQRQYVSIFSPEYGQKIQILSNVSMFLYNIGQNEKALEAYHQIMLFDPKNADLYANFGAILSNLGRKEEAVEIYRQGLVIDPKNAVLYFNLGNTLLKLGREEEAVEVCRQGVAIDPKNVDLYFNLGNTLLKLGRKEETVEAYKKFIELADRKKYWVFIKRAERIIAIWGK